MTVQIPTWMLQIPVAFALCLPLIIVMIMFMRHLYVNGAPDFHTVVAGIMVFFGTALQAAVGGAFLLKLYYPCDAECIAINDSYIFGGTIISIVKTCCGAMVKLCAPKNEKSKAPEQSQSY